MSALAPDTHFGALQQKANDCGRDATACDFDILPMPRRGWPRGGGVLYNRRQA
jgi:hypothetical protein